MKIIPTVFASNKKDFLERLDNISKLGSEAIQVDFMDGKFVGKKSPGPEDIGKLKKGIKFEAHLMVNNPFELIDGLKKNGFSKIIFHYEALEKIEKIESVCYSIKQKKMKPWVAFNPSTSSDVIMDVVRNVDSLEGVMLMGHEPGIESKVLLNRVVLRAKNLKRQLKNLKIQIDGGINDGTIEEANKTNADIVNVGSFVSGAGNLAKMKEKLKILKGLVK